MKIAIIAALLLVFALLFASGCLQEAGDEDNGDEDSIPSPPDLPDSGEQSGDDAKAAQVPMPPALPE